MPGRHNLDVTMSTRLLLCLSFLLLTLPLHAQQDAKEKKILKNADIVMMVQNHFDDETLIKIIGMSATDFDVSEDTLVDLMKQGVSSPVLRAMLSSAHKKQAGNKTAPAEESPTASTNSTEPTAAAVATPSHAPDPNFATRMPAPAQPTAAAPVTTAAPAY